MKLDKNTQILGGIALILTVLSVYYYSQNNTEKEINALGEAYLEGLENSITLARNISLSGSEATTTLTFDGTTWRVEERSSYPANPAYVQGLLSGMIQARRVEPKTDNPDYYERLGLGDAAMDIQVRSENGDTLAALTAGDQFFSPSGGGVTTFVLDHEANRAWTVSGLPQLSSFPAYWLVPDVVGISPFRIKGFDITFGDGQVWAASRPDLDNFFTFNSANASGVNPATLQGIANALNEVILEDVIDFSALSPFLVASATYHTFDGLAIRLEFYENEGTIWTTLKAEYNEAVLMQNETPSVLVDAPPDGAAEADAMNALWQGRAYLIPIEKISVILTRLEALGRG